MIFFYTFALIACIVIMLYAINREEVAMFIAFGLMAILFFALGAEESKKLDKKLPEMNVSSRTVYFHEKGQSADSVKMIEINSRIICVKYGEDFSCLRK